MFVCLHSNNSLLEALTQVEEEKVTQWTSSACISAVTAELVLLFPCSYFSVTHHSNTTHPQLHYVTLKTWHTHHLMISFWERCMTGGWNCHFHTAVCTSLVRLKRLFTGQRTLRQYSAQQQAQWNSVKSTHHTFTCHFQILPLQTVTD